MLVATYLFDNAAEYTLVNTQIDTSEAILDIVDNPGQVFSQDFSVDTGFTYNAALAEFTAGQVQQKNQTPANSILGATYTTNLSANWATAGSLSETLIGSPTITANRLNCTGGGNNAVFYTNTGIGTIGNTGSIKFKFRPAYSGTPPANYGLVAIRPTSGNNNRITLFHGSTGVPRLTAFDSAGTIIHSAANIGAAWSPTAGTTYEMELNFQPSTGLIRLFINGVLHGSTSATTYTRTATATILQVGASFTTYTNCDGSFEDVVAFNTVQHTASYTPGYSLPELVYAGSTVVLPTFAYSGLGSIQAVESSLITEAGTPRFTVAGQYWNGSAWVASDNTYAQANDSTTIINQLPNLTVTGAGSFVVQIIFTDTNTQGSVDMIDVTVTGQKYVDEGSILTDSAIITKLISSFAVTESTPTNSDIGYIVQVDGVDKYWDGAAWSNSDGSAAQSASASDTNTNIGTLVSNNSSVKFKAALTSTANTVTSRLDELTVNYEFGAVSPDTPDLCTVYGYILDVQGNAIEGATLAFKTNRDDQEYQEAASNIIGESAATTSDDEGFFSVSLIRSSEYEVSGPQPMQYSLEIGFPDGSGATTLSGSTILFIVPDSVDVNITDQISAF